MSSMDENELLALAHRMADAAGPLALGYFRTPLDVITKADESPVTLADRAVEQAMRTVLAEQAPAHGIYGEEHGQERLDAEYVWVLDPIDGTRSFISGSPLWGTLIALLHQGRPLLGMIDIPFTRERWWAAPGCGARYQHQPARTSGCGRLAQARLYATSPDIFDAADAPRFERLSRAAAMRRFGGDCYSYALLASGHVDLVAESGLQPYDYLSLVPIIEAAGGRISDWQGQPLHLGSEGHVLASASAALHDEALELLNRDC